MIVFHECVLMTMPSRFTVPFITTGLLACAKIMRNFSTTIAGCTMFLGVLDEWFINPVAYSGRCRGDNLRQYFIYIYKSFACDGTSLESTNNIK